MFEQHLFMEDRLDFLEGSPDSSYLLVRCLGILEILMDIFF